MHARSDFYTARKNQEVHVQGIPVRASGVLGQNPVEVFLPKPSNSLLTKPFQARHRYLSASSTRKAKFHETTGPESLSTPVP